MPFTKKNYIKNHLKKHGKYKKKIGIIYSSNYNISACGIEKCHPFDSKKYGRIFQNLMDEKLITNKNQILKPSKCPRMILELVLIS